MVARGTVVMAATARHPGFKSLSCHFFSFLLSLQTGCLPYISADTYVFHFQRVDNLSLVVGMAGPNVCITDRFRCL